MKSALRKDYLAAMGLEGWVQRRPGEATLAGEPSVHAHAGAAALAPQPAATPDVPAAAPFWPAIVERALLAPERSDGVASGRAAVAAEQREAAFDWDQLRERVTACTRCGLSATRTQTVFGVGNRQADWLVVGEAPGAEEDLRGEPFVGRAGLLLNSMLRAIGLAREQVYIANVLKCRPPNNRNPQAKETVECMPFLERQAALLRPKIVLVVGRIAAQNLLRTTAPLGGLRQQVHTFGPTRIPVVVTYHPAYLLRTPADKRKAWEDLKFAREVCGRG